MDPPDHTVLRRMLTPRFTTNAIESLRPRILDLVDQHLRAMAAHGPGADLVAAYSWPIPSQVICELLGIPVEDRADFQRYIDAGFNFSRGSCGSSTTSNATNRPRRSPSVTTAGDGRPGSRCGSTISVSDDDISGCGPVLDHGSSQTP
jgi:cytochrome P450